jgi:hypothetical protein
MGFGGREKGPSANQSIEYLFNILNSVLPFREESAILAFELMFNILNTDRCAESFFPLRRTFCTPAFPRFGRVPAVLLARAG